ncbi:MAG TPA: hypothetical protein VNW15_13515 [Rhizomicrobium sp.]|nr:hypothetical protein [Rhizomicrobium sp.]
MAGNRQAAAAKTIMSDATIKAKTGRDWAAWFAALDKAGAAKLDHAAIAKLAAGKLGAGDWYGQMVAVSYERVRGIRALNQKCDGEFSVSVSKVVPVPLGKLFKAATGGAGGWFPKGAFEETSRTADKYWRGKWKGGQISFYFYAKGPDKSQITVDSGKLAGAEVIEKERAAWKKAVAKLEAML